ncbi:recombinase family protein [Singulisphaera acidiphila]|uniref:recombinase family protein n=1 Tax=Singulisphaera acidiphila TaxID=466153 RepID=UPI0002473558|nr:recombinase family protein [Singulisphaera acidiphila]
MATAERLTPPPAFLPVRRAEVTAPTPTTGRAMTGMLAVFAEFERKILRERGRAGIAQARKEGRPLGRPRTASLKADHVLRLKAERVSHSEIARRLGIGRTSVRRSLAAG